MDGNEVYELREARSEISRHHMLIADLRDALRWALDSGVFNSPSDREPYRAAQSLLNRQVG